MTTETVKYVIEAEDRATSVFRGVRSSVASTGKELSNVAKHAKTGSEGFSLLTSSLSQVIPGLDTIAGSVGQITGVLGKLKGAGDAAGASLMLLKAGAVVGMAVATHEAVVWLWKWIDGYDELINRVNASKAELDFSTAKLLKDKDSQFKNFLADMKAFEKSLSGQNRLLANQEFVKSGELTDLNKRVGLIQEASKNSVEFAAEHEGMLKSLEAERDALIAQLDVIKQMKLENDRQQKLDDLKAQETFEEAMREKAREEREERRKFEAEQFKQFQKNEEEKAKVLRKFEQEQFEMFEKAEEKRRDGWRKSADDMADMFRKSLEDRLKGEETGAEALRRINLQLIEMRHGPEAARAADLMDSGLETGLASEIARQEGELKKLQAGKEVKTNTASESRLLSGRVEMDAARQTANATARVRELTEKIWKQNEQMLAAQEKIAKNTENQLETLR